MRPLGWLARQGLETVREACWVARCLPRLVLLLLAAGVGLWLAGHHLAATLSGTGLAGVLLWPVADADSWERLEDRVVLRRHRLVWAATAAAVGLSVPPRDPGSPSRVPRLAKAVCRDRVATLTIRLAPGQTLDDVDRAAPALAAAWGAHAVRVAPDGPSHAVLTLALRDALAEPSLTRYPAPVDDPANPAGLHTAGVEVGRALSGGPWTVDPRVHTLVAGMTGAGKASVMWSLLVGLAPAVRAGNLRLVGVELKAGMELTHAASLFSALATTPGEAVGVLEREAPSLASRAAAMAGTHRAHSPTPQDPHVLVVVDELAALTAYIPDPVLRRRADAALRLLLTQGRAPGWSVWAWVQDPRKDTVPMRNLFPTMIGLRLRDAYETEMVLGPTAATRSAPCHRISGDQPGTGYAVTEDGAVSKVRAHYATDDLIHTVAADYPTPHRLPPAVLTEPDEPHRATWPVARATSVGHEPAPEAASPEPTLDSAAPRPPPRKPRSPRQPRTASAPARRTNGWGGDAA